MLLWTWVYKYLPESLLSVLLGGYNQKWNFWMIMVILFLIFWGTIILFFTILAMHKGSNFSVSSPTFVIFWFLHLFACFVLVIDILLDMKLYLTVVLTCISLMISGVKHLCMCLLAICISFWRNVFNSIYSFFNLVVFMLPSCRNSLYIYVLTSYQIYNLQKFSPVSWVAFLLCWQCLLMHKSFKFDVVQFSHFLLYCLCFCVIFKKSLPNPMSQSFSLCFLLRVS